MCPCGEHTMSPLSNCLCLTHTEGLSLSQLCVTAQWLNAWQADTASMNPQVKPQGQNSCSMLPVKSRDNTS